LSPNQRTESSPTGVPGPPDPPRRFFGILSWHASALVLLLGVWGAFTLVAGVLALARNGPLLGFTFFDYLLFISIPNLLLGSAYALYRRSSLSIAFFALLPFPYFLIAIRFDPYLSPMDSTLDIHYLARFPMPVLCSSLFFLGCMIYCLFQRKHGKLK
jgi:hypothetical protein